MNSASVLFPVFLTVVILFLSYQTFNPKLNRIAIRAMLIGVVAAETIFIFLQANTISTLAGIVWIGLTIIQVATLISDLRQKRSKE